MKKIYLLWFGLILLNNTKAQTTITLTPSQDAAIGYHDGAGTANNNYGSAIQNAAYCIPSAAAPPPGVNANRALIDFSLATIPAGATIISAYMNLYATGPIGSVQGHFGANATYLERITQSWQEFTATWNNQPNTTNVNSVILPQSTNATQNYLNINVLALVQDMINNPSTSFGFKLRLVSEVVTNGLLFCSKDHPNQSLMPQLIITYSICTQDIQLSSSVICSGNSASISASGSGSSAATWYASPSSTAVIGSGNVFSTPTLTASNVPSFYSYFASNTCTSSPRSAITITVNPAPNLVLTSSNTKSVICRGQSVTLNASGANTYSWSQNSSVFSNNALTSVTPAGSTTYVLSGTNLNNCTSSASISLLVADCLGISQISNANDFVMFPNPTTDKLNVTFTSVQKNIVLTLFNIDGKQISNGVYNNTEKFSVDVSNLAKGIYFYNIQSDKETKTGKLVVDR